MKTIFHLEGSHLRFFIFFIFFSQLLLSCKSFSQCPNTDFSLGNFSNWTGSTYDGINNIPGIVQGTPNSPPSNPGQHTIMNAPDTDPNTGGLLSVIPQGGTSSCRLGNDLCNACITTAWGARLEYTFIVDPSNCIFTYQYAVVLQDPGGSHTITECPKFTIYVLDTIGNVVDPVCGIFEVTASGGLPGFQTCLPASSVCEQSDSVVWKDWTAVGIDLSPYIGQNITIQFTASDCTLGGHFGYAYISCSCGSSQITQQYVGNSVTLTAPAGFDSYSWSPGGQTTQSVTIINPVYGTVYTCQCTSMTGCLVTLYVTVEPPFLYQQCQGNSVIITAPPGFSSYLWSTGDTGNPITITNLIYGDSISCICDSIIIIDTIISVQTVTGLTANSTTICSGDNAVITASGTYSYEWSNGQSGQSISVSPATTTIYTVTATSSEGCSATANATVTVSPGFTPDICMVTVDTNSNHNLIIWEKQVTAAIDQYYIYRESSISGIYNLIGSQNYSDYSTFTDTASNSLQQPYRYKLAIFDTCSTLSQQSSYHQTIHLAVSSGMGGAWNLQWNNYEGYSFSTYNLYRGTNPGNLSLFYSVANTVNSFTDLTPPAGTVYYMIEAERPTPCNPSLKSSIYSSISNVSYAGYVGMQEYAPKDAIQIIPNPNNGYFTIKTNEAASFEILNSLGQAVFSGKINDKIIDVDLSSLSKGMYFLKLQTEKRNFFRKIVIE